MIVACRRLPHDSRKQQEVNNTQREKEEGRMATAVLRRKPIARPKPTTPGHGDEFARRVASLGLESVKVSSEGSDLSSLSEDFGNSQPETELVDYCHDELMDEHIMRLREKLDSLDREYAVAMHKTKDFRSLLPPYPCTYDKIAKANLEKDLKAAETEMEVIALDKIITNFSSSGRIDDVSGMAAMTSCGCVG